MTENPAGKANGKRRRLRELIPERARARALASAGATLNRLGYELRPRSEEALTAEEARRGRLLRSRKITVVLDVGASEGLYARQLRQIGFDSRIVSFEPLAEPFAALEEAAAQDELWDCRRLALGSSNGTEEINVAGNSTSSSLLGMAERHLQSAPESTYVGTEQVRVARLDSIWPELIAEGDRVYLNAIDCLQAELSFVPLYREAPSYLEVIDYLGSRGFRLAGLEEGHDDRRTGEMLQANGIFVR